VLRLDEWLPEIQELPAIPAAVTRLLVALDSTGSDAREVAHILESDPALATKVLRLANSVAYAAAEKSGNVQRAVVRLGYSNIKGLALSHGLYLSLSGENRDVLDAHFWGHCVAAGLAAQEIARSAKLHSIDDAFIIGLLHDVGQVLLAHWFQADYRALIREHRQGSVPLDLLETRRLGVSHAAVGAAFLKHWGMPATVIHAVEFHHELYRVPATIKRFPALAELADTCAQRAGYYGLSGSHPNRAYSLGAMRLLATNADALTPVEAYLQAEIPRHASLLRIQAPAAHSSSLLPSEAA